MSLTCPRVLCENALMAVSELTLWAARLLVLVLMYAFLLALVLAVRADARAARPAPKPVQPVAAPMPAVSQLEMLSGTAPVTGRKYALYGPLIIGRGTNCDISIPNRFVSTRHARIFPHDGAWMLEDLGSTNGTLVNGEPLDGPRALSPDDRVLSVSGDRNEEDADRRDRVRCYQLEIYFGQFERQVVLPGDIRIDRDAISASCKDGFLVVTLPKRTDRSTGSRTIPISE